ncbi:MAG: hypothetical protein RLZZ126_1489, partial [Pseudomonadota bacterium]
MPDEWPQAADSVSFCGSWSSENSQGSAPHSSFYLR